MILRKIRELMLAPAGAACLYRKIVTAAGSALIPKNDPVAKVETAKRVVRPLHQRNHPMLKNLTQKKDKSAARDLGLHPTHRPHRDRYLVRLQQRESIQEVKNVAGEAVQDRGVTTQMADDECWV
jgi:hypothetical protein